MSSSVWFGWAVVASIILLLLTAPAVLIWTGHLQTGFGDFTSPTGEFQRAKTLWDWMDLLLAPAVLGAFGALFSWMLGRGQRAADERRAEIEQDRANEAALQKYLDSMMDLLKEGFNGPEVTDINRSIARARTLTVLRQLRHVNGERKGLLLTFLIESHLLDKQPIIDLSKVDLTGINLSETNLSGANLSGAILPVANFRETKLNNADLSKVLVPGANFSGAELERATLTEAIVSHARLANAKLTGASLSGARFDHADLSGAILSHARLSNAKLTRANLRGATLIKADLQGTDLFLANLRGADLSEADLRGANLIGPDLGRGRLRAALRTLVRRGADALWVDLRNANLSGADLSEADLSEADLRAANLRGTNLKGATLRGARVTDTQLASAKSLEGAILPDRTVCIGQARPPAGLKVQDAKEQPEPPDDLDADEDNSQEMTR